MKRLLLIVTTAFALLTVVVVARDTKTVERTALSVSVAERNPWTHLKLADDTDPFHFAVISDRTGGHRAGIFSRAVQQINLLRPAFVVSVGDLIEGSTDPEVNRQQWKELDGYLAKLTVPFFYAPGNHDHNNAAKQEVWKERYGRSYYHFRYRNTLFVILDCYDNREKNAPGKNAPEKDAEAKEGGRNFSATQLAYVKQALKDNADVRWTFVILHQPLWTGANVAATGWLDVEQMLAGRKYTVFCGHIHIYRKYLRNGMNYYQLATTGGGSSLRGPSYGEFDQVAWVSMTPDGPVLANLQLDGIHPDDLSRFESTETGRNPEKATGLARVRGTITLDGKPLSAGTLAFYPVKGRDPQRVRPTGQARIDPDGTFTVYSNRGPAGLAPGEYDVEIGPPQPIVIAEKKAAAPAVPQKYRSYKTSSVRIEVAADKENLVNIDLQGRE